MMFFVILVIVEFILYNNGGYGMHLPWDYSPIRKLLYEVVPPIPENGKSMFPINSEKGVVTGLALKSTGRLVVIPLPWGLDQPKITNFQLYLKSSNEGWNFWRYHAAKEPIESYYTGPVPTTGKCEIIGTEHKVPVNILVSKTNAINVQAISGKICFADIGAALWCEGKRLVGIVHHLLENVTETKKSTEKSEEADSKTTKEAIEETTVPVEVPAEKTRRKRDDKEEVKEEVKEEKEGEKEGEKEVEKQGEKEEGKEGEKEGGKEMEKEGEKEEEKHDKENEELLGECSNSCVVTPMGMIKVEPPRAVKKETKKREPEAKPRKSGVITIIANVDLLLILLSTMFLLF